MKEEIELDSQKDRSVLSILDRLACPQCRTSLLWKQDSLLCQSCSTLYPVVDDIADLRPPVKSQKKDLSDWSEHWSDEKQEGIAQKFFSFYRKAVFSRAVRHFLGRYFSQSGVFVEAGSGTAETSMRLNGRGGKKTYVALDVVLPVLKKCHEIMEKRICGDIFRLPFQEGSIDGIWNVGVMEHFTHPQIDQIMTEFHRVLVKGGRVVLLWPGVSSAPQKILRLVECNFSFEGNA